jgi:hypothetical protein
MPEHWLSEADRSRFTSFPPEIPEADVITFFTLHESDLQFVRRHYRETGRLGIALQLCALRYFGFIPDELVKAPATVARFLAHQLEVLPKTCLYWRMVSGARRTQIISGQLKLIWGFTESLLKRKNKSTFGCGRGHWNISPAAAARFAL